MIEIFVKRPATTIMFVLFFIVLGVVSFFNLNIESTPKVDFPFVTVQVIYRGATPLEVESQVVKKIEDAISEISEIKRIQSRADESVGFTFVEFILGVDVNIKAIEVKDKVEALLNTLPEGADKPIIQKFDPLEKPILDLILSSDKHTPKYLREFADKKIKNHLSAVEGVASIDIYGGEERQINVKLDPVLMKKYYISINDILGAMAKRNLNVPGGTFDKNENSISVRFVGEFANLEDIRNMILVSSDGTRFPLKEIAIVEDGAKDIETIARFNSKPAVGLGVMKVSDGNAVSIGRDLKKSLPDISSFLEDGMKLEIAKDDTKIILKETLDTEINIAIGIGLTVIILLIFTGNIRITIIASLVIPASIISTMFLVDKFGFSINFTTLLAIATCLGTLVANAIVIIESVLTHIEQGKDRKQAAIDGTKEVAVAVFAASGTNVVVFTPIAFMGGIVGQFMNQFGLTVVFATLFSIMASFSLTPMLCGLMLKEKKVKEGEKKAKENIFVTWSNRGINLLFREYERIFHLLMRFHPITIIICVILFISSFSLMKWIGGSFFPPSDRNLIVAKITLPQGSIIERTLEAAKEMEDLFKKREEVESVLTSIDGVEAYVYGNLVDFNNREKSDKDIIDELIPEVAKIPDIEIDLLRGTGMGGGSNGDVSISLYGIDYEKMIEESKQMKQMMIDSGYFRSVTSSYKNPKKELKFLPNDDKMTTYGVANSTIGSTIRTAVTGNDDNIYREEGEEYDINITIDDRYKGSKNDIMSIFTIARKGLLPISALGELKDGLAFPTIERRDRTRVIQLDGFLSKSSADQVQRILEKNYFSKIPFANKHGFRYVGMAEMQSESQTEIVKAFVLATILTYMILAAILNSFVHPFTIATAIFTSFSGVVAMLFFLEKSVNIGSMLAVVMLVGLAVNNAILMLDSTQQKLTEGLGIKEALLAGARNKFRAILMSSIAIVFGALPQLFDISGSKSSMGAVLIGGMLASIFFTFILTPVAFLYLEKLRRLFVRS